MKCGARGDVSGEGDGLPGRKNGRCETGATGRTFGFWGWAGNKQKKKQIIYIIKIKKSIIKLKMLVKSSKTHQ